MCVCDVFFLMYGWQYVGNCIYPALSPNETDGINLRLKDFAICKYAFSELDLKVEIFRSLALHNFTTSNHRVL